MPFDPAQMDDPEAALADLKDVWDALIYIARNPNTLTPAQREAVAVYAEDMLDELDGIPA